MLLRRKSIIAPTKDKPNKQASSRPYIILPATPPTRTILSVTTNRVSSYKNPHNGPQRPLPLGVARAQPATPILHPTLHRPSSRCRSYQRLCANICHAARTTTVAIIIPEQREGSNSRPGPGLPLIRWRSMDKHTCLARHPGMAIC
jgi:hypothetical protein